MPLKRAARGLLPLLDAARAVLQEAESQPGRTPDDMEPGLVHDAKKIALLTLAVAHQKYGAQLEQQQEIVMNLSDIFMEVFAMESALLRSQKLSAAGRGVNAADVCAVYLRDAIARCRALVENDIECLRRGRRTATESFSRACLFEPHTSECDCAAASDCRTTPCERTLYGLSVRDPQH